MRFLTLAVPDDFDPGTLPGAVVHRDWQAEMGYRVVVDVIYGRAGSVFSLFYLDKSRADALRTYQRAFPEARVTLGEILGKHSCVRIPLASFQVDDLCSADLGSDAPSYLSELDEFFGEQAGEVGMGVGSSWPEIVAARVPK